MTGITDLHNDIPSSSGTGSGPGRLVRQAREKANLSIEDLAAQIKLARLTLDAIERDDFAQLNEQVYVRGYYRKLAKVLPVAEADLLAAYERVAGHRAPPHPSKLILAGGAELGSGRRISFKLAAAVVVLGLFIGVLAFWSNNRAAPEKPLATPAAVEIPATVVPEPEQAPVLAPAAPSQPVPAPAAVEGEVKPVRAPPTAPVAAMPSTEAAPAAATTGAVGALQIQFSGSSWTEVKDASGKVLLSGLVEGGTTQTLDGKPPFSVFLGNAPGVRITYNGKLVDTASFRRGDNTARITLP